MQHIQKFEFCGHPISVIEHAGRPVWLCNEVGKALEYSNPGKLSEAVTGKWSGELVEGRHYVKLASDEVAALRELIPDLGISPHTGQLTLLYEEGVYRAAILARTKKGREFRDWLSDEVVPRLRKGELVPRGAAYVTPTELEALRGEVSARLDRLAADQLALGTDIRALASGIGELALAVARQVPVLAAPAPQPDLPVVLAAPGYLRAGEVARKHGTTTRRVSAVCAALRKEYGSFGIQGRREGWLSGSTTYYSPVEVAVIKERLRERGWLPKLLGGGTTLELFGVVAEA